jgi:hypothetical protein
MKCTTCKKTIKAKVVRQGRVARIATKPYCKPCFNIEKHRPQGEKGLKKRKSFMDQMYIKYQKIKKEK